MNEAIYALLEARHAQYNTPDFIENDPISIPHCFSVKEDIEIAGFLAAILAWGKRSMIIKSAHLLMERMDNAPHDFVVNASEIEHKHLDGFVYRTFQTQDAIGILSALQHIYKYHGGLANIFVAQANSQNKIFDAIVHARTLLLSSPHLLKRTHKHIANPAAGASAKRINMYLRWMVRKDTRGVDFGIWSHLSPADLICPLDVHTGNVSRNLGLLSRKQNDWKAAIELTQQLQKFCPEDPVKYDFALFGLGIYEGWKENTNP